MRDRPKERTFNVRSLLTNLKATGQPMSDRSQER